LQGTPCEPFFFLANGDHDRYAFCFHPKGMEMEQIQIMGMELEKSWIIAGGAAVVLLIAIVWFLLRRRSKRDGEPVPEKSPEATVRLTEPTLEPLPEVSEGVDTEPADVEPTGETAVETPDTEPAAPSPIVAESGDPETAAEPESMTESVSEAGAEHEPEPRDEPAEVIEAPTPIETPPPPPVTDPAFLAARETFERALLEGNFSRLDVFEAYARAQQGPDAPGVPRSEFFHRVVNQALETRDAFEALLSKQDRERFVDIHSRYLDDVTEEADASVRERLHREHQEKLEHLRPEND
jgi:hypothetical protein